MQSCSRFSRSCNPSECSHAQVHARVVYARHVSVKSDIAPFARESSLRIIEPPADATDLVSERC
jgi:hypothetical protein